MFFGIKKTSTGVDHWHNRNEGSSCRTAAATAAAAAAAAAAATAAAETAESNHVCRSADSTSDSGTIHFSESKVGELHFQGALLEKDVLGLEIAMRDGSFLSREDNRQAYTRK